MSDNECNLFSSDSEYSDHSDEPPKAEKPTFSKEEQEVLATCKRLVDASWQDNPVVPVQQILEQLSHFSPLLRATILDAKTNWDRVTALIQASYYARYDEVKLLLEAGSDPSICAGMERFSLSQKDAIGYCRSSPHADRRGGVLEMLEEHRLGLQGAVLFASLRRDPTLYFHFLPPDLAVWMENFFYQREVSRQFREVWAVRREGLVPALVSPHK